MASMGFKIVAGSLIGAALSLGACAVAPSAEPAMPPKTEPAASAVATPAFSLPASATAAPTTAKSCAALTDFTIPGSDLKIDRAVEVPAGPMQPPPGAPPGPAINLPAHCHVEGSFERRTGIDGKAYALRIALNLPREWNGRFMFQGGGGLNGVVNPPIGNGLAGDDSALGRGFAIVSTDSGHAAQGPFDGSFLNDQEATLNFLYQSVGKVSVVAKVIVASYYGQGPHHSYFVGCSTGGREGMILSQRFPGYFDGIVAGAPAIRTNYSNLAIRWMNTQLNGIAPKDATGKPLTAQALSESDRKLVVDGFLAACDALDGAKDNLVFATQSCKFDPTTLVCKGSKNGGCLTRAQADAVKRGMAGPKTRGGQQVYPGFLYDTGLANTRGLPGRLVGTVVPEGQPAGTTINIDVMAAEAHDGRSMAGDTNGWTNLSGFRGRGNKLLFFHGVSDPWFSALETVDYYERLKRDNGPGAVEDWSRLFLVPGMAHCRGGDMALDRFDMVTAIVDWAEKDQAPSQIIATGPAMPGVSRPLCPYPQFPKYTGAGDMNAAANFQCSTGN